MTFQLLGKAISCFFPAIALLGSYSATDAQVIYTNDFGHYKAAKTYKRADLESDWNDPEWNDGVDENRVQVVRGSQANGRKGYFLKVNYPKGKHGTKDTGAQWIMDLDDSYDEVMLSYSVKFRKRFDFVKGGKLPGLVGGTAPTGNTAATGTNGFAARMMWRTFHSGNPGSPRQKKSNAISYAKYFRSGYDEDGKDEDETFFESNGSLTVLKSNKWYDIAQRIKINDHWKSNGIIQIWVDDQLVVNRTDVRFRTNKNFAIDKFYFSTFFGGDSSWRTSKNEVVYFDNFMITALDD